MKDEVDTILEVLVGSSTTGVIIVQTDKSLETRCAKCRFPIWWSSPSSHWYCSLGTCGQVIENVTSDANSSMASFNASIFDLTEWVSKWYNVPVGDVRVVVTR